MSERLYPPRLLRPLLEESQLTALMALAQQMIDHEGEPFYPTDKAPNQLTKAAKEMIIKATALYDEIVDSFEQNSSEEIVARAWLRRVYNFIEQSRQHHLSEQAFLATREQVKAELATPQAPSLAGIVKFGGKSMRPDFVDQAYVDWTGLKDSEFSLFGDRQFMVVNPKGMMKSQRSDSELARIELKTEGQKITLIYHGEQQNDKISFLATLAADEQHPEMATKVHTTEGIKGIDQGEAVAEWLTKLLGRPSRLVWQKESEPRQRDEVFAGLEHIKSVLRFADSSPITALSYHTLDLLNDLLAQENPEWYMEPLSFRMNLLFKGDINEHTLTDKVIKIGEVYFYVWRTKWRCPMPANDQFTGEERGVHPTDRKQNLAPRYQKILEEAHDVLEVPAEWRYKDSKGGGDLVPLAMLGVDLIPLTTGYIKAGDQVEILDEIPEFLRQA